MGGGTCAFAEVDRVERWKPPSLRFGDRLYAYAAETVRLMRGRLEWPGVLKMLSSVSAGQGLADAYRSGAGETLAQLEARLKTVQPAIVTRTRPDGDVEWTLFTGAPSAP